MRKTSISLTCIAISMISACATTGLKEPFTASATDAVVLVTMQYANWGLDPVNLDTKMASGKYYSIAGPSWIDTPRLKGDSTKRVFGFKKIPSGTYALRSVYSGNGNAGTTTCIDHFAPVLDIKAGTVNLIPELLFVMPKPPTEKDLADVRGLVNENEMLDAPVAAAEVIGFVDYNSPDKKRCKFRKEDAPIEVVENPN